MPFSATGEHPNNWQELNKLLDDLSGDWLFRGAIADWDPKPSLERWCNHWDVPLANMPKVERKLLREFKRHPEARSLATDPDDDLEWFSIMQHYGAPTRLLDWSYSPFPALLFALDSLLKIPKKTCDDAKAAVWAIRADWFKEVLPSILSSKKRTALDQYLKKRNGLTFRKLFVDAKPRTAFVHPVNPMHLNERLSVQQGVFLCPGDISQSFADNLNQLGPLTGKKNARSFIISRELLPECFKALHRMNVSARTLYPGLLGYAQWLRHRLPDLPDVPL